MAQDINKKLEQRMINFSVLIINLCQKNKSHIPYSIIDQVIRSSSSVGANYAEANDAVSRADFKNKIAIAKKEAAETRYWLKLIEQLKIEIPNEIVQENTELILILQKIINTLRNGTSAK